MSKPLVLNPQQQQQFGQRLSEELGKMIMSWDDELLEWYAIAIKALDFSNPLELQIRQLQFRELFKTEETGLNMNTVMVLANNIEARTPVQMGYSAEDWAYHVLPLNQRVCDRWNELKKPAEKAVIEEFKELTREPRIFSLNKGEA